jgi:hypothetical protein
VWSTGALQKRTSVHFVGNHIIDFANADHASGIVYCHDELEQPATKEWKPQCCSTGTSTAGSTVSGALNGADSIVGTLMRP